VGGNEVVLMDQGMREAATGLAGLNAGPFNFYFFDVRARCRFGRDRPSPRFPFAVFM
jgi:hypothetical protein